MACFLVPTAVGVITTAFRKKFPKNLHVGWLNVMFLGGALALAVEHIAHGEIVPWPPFLTAMTSPASTGIMLNEMITVGVPMTIAIAFTWIVMVVVYEKIISNNPAVSGV